MLDNPIQKINTTYTNWLPNKIKNNFIYFTIYVPTNIVKKDNMKNYIYCSYNVEKNIVNLKFNNDVTNLDEILDILQKSLNREILEHSKTNISANLSLFYPNRDIL